MSAAPPGHGAPGNGAPPLPPASELEAIEEAALGLARLAGERIAATLDREIAVEYKDGGADGRPPSNPVSEVDREVERLLRERVAERFPGHAVLGEESGTHPGPGDAWVWVVDPVDGTTNFVNGFPLYAASVGVLYGGRPVAGAIWCSASHALRPGVYHARLGGALRFEGGALPPVRPASGVSRALGAGPAGSPPSFRGWDIRVTGSAALECAYVAAGVFRYAAFTAPGIWDVAAGVCLVRAAGLSALTRGPDGWRELERFEAPSSVREEREPSLRDWRQFLAIGEDEATGRIRDDAGRRRTRLAWRLRRAAYRLLR